MPMTYPNSRKEGWVEQLAQGKTLSQIARKAKCDVRTVKKAIEDIRNRRAAREAMTELYREALRTHMNRLNSALEVIIDGLNRPEPFYTALGWKEVVISQNIPQKGGEKGREDNEQSGDVFSDRALLAEHLKNSKGWRALAVWNRSLDKHRASCGILQIRSYKLLKELTGLKAYEEPGAKTGPLLHAENTGGLLCRMAIQYLSDKKNTLKFKEELAVDSERGFVLNGTTVLVESIKESQDLAQCLDSIVEAFKLLINSTEAKQVLDTYQQLGKALPKAKNELRALQLIGVLPGQCNICRQLGL